MQDYKKLRVWEKAHQLVLTIYTLLRNFPDDEKFSLCQQLKRAAYSVPSNIVEGCGRRTQNELRAFLYNSLGSAKEVEYFLLLAKDLHYISDEKFEAINTRISEINMMLISLLSKLRSDYKLLTTNYKLQTANQMGEVT